jgi:uncharacterized protein
MGNGVTRMAVFADTHGNKGDVLAALAENRPFDAVVHLGDGVADGAEAAAEMNISFYGISGNEDHTCSFPDLHMIVVEDLGVMCVHGHQLDINPYGEAEAMEAHYAALAEIAKRAGAKIILFGHTHRPLIQMLDGIALLNPGDMYIGSSTRPTFGVLEKSGKTVELMVLQRGEEGGWNIVSALRVDSLGCSVQKPGSPVAGGI